MRNLIAVAIILLISFTACKQDSANNEASKQSSTEASKKAAIKTISTKKASTDGLFTNYPGPATSTSLRGKANIMLEYRKERSERAFWPIIESGVWEFAFVFNGNEMEKPSATVIKWIDFGQDGTFVYGEGKEEITKGIYHYDLDKAELILIDNDERAGPNVWKVNLVGDAMVFLGNAELTTNAYQIKLDKMDARP